MNYFLTGICLAVFLLFGLPAAAQSGNIISSESKISFTIGHATGKVNGSFSGMQGTVKFDERNPAAGHMEATIDATTINTNNRARDKDLKKEKFFHTEQYPHIRFISKTISATNNGFQVTGDLTIKDKTKEVTIPFKVIDLVTVETPEFRQQFTGSVTLNRKDFDLGLKAFPPIGKTVEVHITALVK